jgi:aryl-alcohol dehydrogenase-like predicted oxidoreductase
MIMSRRTALSAIAASVAAAAAGQANAQPAGRLYRQVPKSGERLPIVGLGTWQAFDIGPRDNDWPQAGQGLQLFLRAGGRVIDSSPMYGRAEEAIGALLAATPLRSRAFLATKIWTGDREDGRRQAERSFELLRTRRIDLLQVHNLLGYDAHMPLLRRLKEEGRIRYIGATHYHSGAYDALERAIRSGDLDFVQLNYSVAEREAERRILPLARESRVAVLVNRPFAGGDVFGRIRARPLPSWAGEIGCTSWAQLILKYVLADSAVTCAIPGTRNPRHIADNLGAALPPLPDAGMRRRILAAALD